MHKISGGVLLMLLVLLVLLVMLVLVLLLLLVLVLASLTPPLMLLMLHRGARDLDGELPRELRELLAHLRVLLVEKCRLPTRCERQGSSHT